jgi:hypothetical protein
MIFNAKTLSREESSRDRVLALKIISEMSRVIETHRNTYKYRSGPLPTGVFFTEHDGKESSAPNGRSPCMQLLEQVFSL